MSMSDEELHRLVEHLAHLHGVSPKEVVAEVTGEPPEGYEFVDDKPDAGESEMAEAQPRKKRGRSHWIAWGTAMTVMGVLVAVVIIAFMKFVSGPAEANIKPGQAGIPSPTATPDTGLAQLNGQTIFFSYPHLFDQVTNQKVDSGSVEEYNLGSKTNYRRLIAVDIRNEPSTLSLGEEPSFKIRQMHPETYRESPVKLGGEAASLMTKLNGQEQTLFWLHGGKVLTIAITSTDTHDDVTTFMKVVTGSVRWKT
jgi:hypothetical protein